MTFRLIAATAVMTALATSAFAESHESDPNIAARQAHMQLYGYNIGLLGGMAKGEVPYDAEAATAAAENIASLAALTQDRYWAEGTDNFDMEGKTKALPAIWETPDDFAQKEQDLVKAAMALAAVAGDGQEAIGPALGPLGQACGACHKQYRQSDN